MEVCACRLSAGQVAFPGRSDYEGRSMRRRGNTLLEVIAASAVIAIALAPGLRILRDAIVVGEQVETADALSTFCAGRLEASLAVTCASWNTTSETGDYSILGYPAIKYSVTKSDAAIDGGIPNRLIAITVTVWNDADGNSALDADEHRQQLGCKIAKMARYDNSGS